MASKVSSPTGRDRLDEAMATLIENQASFVASLRETDRLHAKYDRETTERFARIEAQMAQIIRVLAEHGRILEHMPEAVREKIGSRPRSDWSDSRFSSRLMSRRAHCSNALPQSAPRLRSHRGSARRRCWREYER